jgi:hypothetical protein
MPAAAVIARLIDEIPIDRLKALVLEMMTDAPETPQREPAQVRTAGKTEAKRVIDEASRACWAAARKAKRKAARLPPHRRLRPCHQRPR